MAEAGLNIVSRDRLESVGEAALQPEHGAGLGRSEQLLDLGPAFFNGIEVRRVGWQIAQPGSGVFDEIAHARDLVSRQAFETEGELRGESTMP